MYLKVIDATNAYHLIKPGVTSDVHVLKIDELRCLRNLSLLLISDQKPVAPVNKMSQKYVVNFL